VSVKEQLRRKKQIRQGALIPTLLSRDWVVLSKCREAVGHGSQDATVDPQTFDAYEEILGRLPQRPWKDYPKWSVINARFMDASESATHYLCYGRRLYRGAV
jgi:hypothetical protein